MELTPAKFLSLFLALCAVGWLLFMFAARVLAWMLGRLTGAEVLFHISGLNSYKDISVKFKKGSIESLMIGELRITLHGPFSGLDGGMNLRIPKLQIFLSDSEIIMREKYRHAPRKASSYKRSSPGRGKWMLLANTAKYLTITAMELVVQVPRWTIEIKELDLSTCSEEAGPSLLGVKLMLLACNVFDREKCIGIESCNLSLRERLLSVSGLASMTNEALNPLSIEQFIIMSSIGYDREKGVTVRHADMTCGELTLDIGEELFQGKIYSTKTPGFPENVGFAENNSMSDLYSDETNLGKEKLYTAFINKIPEKASFTLAKMRMKCHHNIKRIYLENEVNGIQASIIQSQIFEDTGGISHVDFHMDCSEVQIFREMDKSAVEIMKIAVGLSFEIPNQPITPLRVEADIKFGGAQCNLLLNKFENWLILTSLFKRRDSKDFEILSGKSSLTMREQNSKAKRNLCWTCTLSAPDMSVFVYNLYGVAFSNVCLQTSHVFLNSVLNQGITVHTELGELCVYMLDEVCKCPTGNLFGVDTNPGCLLHMGRVALDWGTIDFQGTKDDISEMTKTFDLEVTSSFVYLTLERLQYILFFSLDCAAFAKKLLGSKMNPKSRKEIINRQKYGRKYVRILNFSMRSVSLHFCEQVEVTDIDVADPKKVNYGNQGGEVVITKNIDGSARTANISVASFNGIKGDCLQYKICMDIARLSFHFDGSKGDSRVALEKLSLQNQELGPNDKIVTEMTFFALQSGVVIHRTFIAEQGISSRCLICASDFTGRWEPDLHLLFHSVALKVKAILRKQVTRIKPNGKKSMLKIVGDNTRESVHKSGIQGGHKWLHTKLIAVDIVRVTISAALADGVESLLSVESVFSEDIKIGILFEKLRVSLNNATVMKNERFQIARIPSVSGDTSGLDAANEHVKSEITSEKCWDYLIQGSGICIILPYRLECRAIEDAIEDMVRGLKLSMVAQKQSFSMSNKSPSLQQEKQRLPSVGSIKFILHNISAEMEEEPLQGWLDDHYEMIKQHSCELTVRERLLDEAVADERCNQNPSPELGTHLIGLVEGKHIDSLEQKRKLQQQNFEAYFKACQKLQAYESSGSCRSALQKGFTPSVNRGYLLLIRVSTLEMTLRDIKGGKERMIEQIRRLDCVSSGLEIPFSKVYGKHVTIFTSSLEVKLRNYVFPMLSTSSGKCEGYIMFARQATCFPKQVVQEVYIGRWRKLRMLRSESGTTPPFKMYSELPIEFEKADVAYGVGFEPALTDVSYALTVALRKANLSIHESGRESVSSEVYSSSIHSRSMENQPLKKERSLPWWDDMRYYVHGKNSITSANFKWIFLATTNPYERRDMMKIVAGLMEIQQSEGQLSFSAKHFDIFISSLESLVLMQGSKQPSFDLGQSFIHSPFFHLDISMGWDCESGSPLHHYLHALPKELTTREKVYDPFRSTSLTLSWNFFLRNCSGVEDSSGLLVNMDISGCKTKQHVFSGSKKVPTHKMSKDMFCSLLSANTEDPSLVEVPVMNLGGHDLTWIFNWWALYYNPPHKIRTFSKWARFGVPRLPRSGNLSLDKVLTEFMLSVDATPCCIKHASLVRDDPAEGLTFNMNRLKYELCYSRGKQRYSFGTKRDVLELVYQGLDLLTVNSELILGSLPQTAIETVQHSDVIAGEPSENVRQPSKRKEHGFLLSTEYFTLRKQAPKANPMGLFSWQEGRQGFTSSDTACGETDFACGSGSDPTRSDPSDDDGFNVVLPDNCLRVCLYGLKLLWTIKNRDAVWAWVEDISRAFESPKPSPSRQYFQRKLIENQNKLAAIDATHEERSRHTDSPKHNKWSSIPPSPSWQERVLYPFSPLKKAGSQLSDTADAAVAGSLTAVGDGIMDLGSSFGDALMKESWSADTEEEGTMHFMVNVVQPQFNLHSEDARGRFLLAAASGRVIARSFHSIIYVRPELIEHTFKIGGEHHQNTIPELTWKRREVSVLLEHVQAHVAPTDVDPGAGLQWLPKIPTGAPKVKRTGALLERVFMPCTMYFQYTRYKSGTADLKVKPLKELSFNSPNIAATMNSRQFQVMVDVISNLLLARLPKPRKASLLNYGDEDLSIEEEADEVVPDGVEEVELARIKLEQTEREFKLLFDDLKRLSQACGTCKGEGSAQGQEDKYWMVSSSKTRLARKLEDELSKKWKSRKLAAISLRNALKRAAQQRFSEKEKNKSPSFAMRISWAIDKVVWSMLSDGETFAEAEISSMILNVDRDYHDVGVAQFTIKYFVVRNCLPNAKSGTLLSAWNPPAEWGRNVMLRVDARQGAPKDGHSALELFQVEIYPLKIYLTELMYRMMWDYLFPEEDQDIQRRQAWKASTTATVRRGKRGASPLNDRSTSSSVRREEASSKVATSQTTLENYPFFTIEDVSRIDFRMTAKALERHACTLAKSNVSTVEHCRTLSSDRTWEENFSDTLTLEAAPRQIPSKYGSPNHPADIESGCQKNANTESNSIRSKEIGWTSKLSKSSSHEDKKPGKVASQEEKKEARLRQQNLEFYNIKIGQVELLVTYEGSRFAVSDLRLLMDTFTRAEFTGTWRRLFSKVKKHIIWGVLKSVAGMQGKKFKDKVQSQGHGEGANSPGSDSDSSDSGTSNGVIYEHFPITQFKRHTDRAGEGFVSSIRGLFNSQRRKAKALVLRTMGVDADVNFQGDCSESEPDTTAISRQLSISKAKKLLRRHTKKLLSTRHRGGILFKDQPQASPSTPPFESEASSDASSCYEDFND